MNDHPKPDHVYRDYATERMFVVESVEDGRVAYTEYSTAHKAGPCLTTEPVDNIAPYIGNAIQHRGHRDKL